MPLICEPVGRAERALTEQRHGQDRSFSERVALSQAREVAQLTLPEPDEGANARLRGREEGPSTTRGLEDMR